MINSHNKTIRGITVLFMLAASPLAMTDSYANEGNEETQKNTKSTNNVQKERLLRAILTEKVINGKLEVRQYALPEDVSAKDMQRMLTIEGETAGWAYVNYKSYQEGIVLFDGKVSKIGKNSWKISDYAADLIGKEPGLGLGEESDKSNSMAKEASLDKDLRYAVIFSGKMAETDTDSVFTISLNHDLNTWIVQDVNLNAIDLALSEDSIGTDQKFRNYDVVK